MLKSLYMLTMNSGRCISPSLWPKNAIIAHIFYTSTLYFKSSNLKL